MGSAPTARTAKSLARLGVTYVLDLTEGGPTVPWAESVVVEHCPLAEYQAPDLSALEAVSARAAAVISSGHALLLHCREGIQRAPLVACAALVQLGWPLPDAVKRVRERRVVANMSEAQLNLLREFGARRAKAGPPAVGAAVTT